MQRALVIISRDLNKGSTQYRFVQYEAALARQGLSLEYLHRKEITPQRLQDLQQYDVVVNQKCLLPVGLSKKIRRYSRRLLFDIDDAVYTRPGRAYDWFTGYRVRRRLYWWLRNADMVLPANNYLANYARGFTNKVVIVPMALDVHYWTPVDRQEKKSFTIGWSGSPANLPKLQQIAAPLQQLLRLRDDCRIAVYCGQRPELPFTFDYVEFSPGTERSFVQQLDIGLLPLTEEEFSRGKSPIKVLQYLACGVPVVANCFGATAEILASDYSVTVNSHSEWVAAIDELLNDAARMEAMRKAGRICIEQQHNLDIVAKQLYQTLLGTQ